MKAWIVVIALGALACGKDALASSGPTAATESFPPTQAAVSTDTRAPAPSPAAAPEAPAPFVPSPAEPAPADTKAPPQASQRLDLARFRALWNKKAGTVSGPQILSEIDAKDGTFLHQFTETLGLLGNVDQKTGAMQKVAVLVVRSRDRLANTLGLRT